MLAISSGDLTLDAGGDASAIWIFQIASTLTTTSGRQVILAGGANAANVFWQVGTSATIGTTSVFQGNILAATSISVLTGSTLTGRALAQGGAVTVDTGGGSASLPAAAAGPAPVITMGVISASYVAPVVAGNIAAVFGSNLSIGQSSSTLPTSLPTTLAESTITLAGQALAASGAPVSRGGYVAIYCTGLGAVTNQPPTGAVAPTSPLSITLTKPTVTIGGVGAGVTFAGLAPGFAGLYQVNAAVPSGVSPGNAVPVVITMETAVSNTVTIAVQ